MIVLCLTIRPFKFNVIIPRIGAIKERVLTHLFLRWPPTWDCTHAAATIARRRVADCDAIFEYVERRSRGLSTEGLSWVGATSCLWCSVSLDNCSVGYVGITNKKWCPHNLALQSARLETIQTKMVASVSDRAKNVFLPTVSWNKGRMVKRRLISLNILVNIKSTSEVGLQQVF